MWTRSLMWICGGKKVPPQYPQPLLCTDTPSEPRISGVWAAWPASSPIPAVLPSPRSAGPSLPGFCTPRGKRCSPRLSRPDRVQSLPAWSGLAQASSAPEATLSQFSVGLKIPRLGNPRWGPFV